MKDKLKIMIDDNEEIALRKEFKTGNIGYGFYGKIEIDNERYQVSLNIIKLKK
jgi:hypothetical protein